MVRSHWLRVHDMRLDALFRLAFAPAPGLLSLSLAAYRDSQVYSTKDTPQHLRAVTSCRSHGFRFYFTPLAGVLFAFPSRYFCTIGSRTYSALDRGRPGFGLGSSCPALLRYRIMEAHPFRLRGCPPLWPGCPAGSATHALSSLHGSSPCGPTTPPLAVWAPPLSLAATYGISVDFFSRVT